MTELNLSSGPPPNVEPTSEAKPRFRVKVCGIASLLSLLFPGLGQLYNRQPRKALWMAATIPLLVVFAGETRIFLSFWGLIAFFLIVITWRVFIIGEAAYVAWTGRKGNHVQRPRIAVTLITAVIVLLGLFPTAEQFLHRYSYLRAFRLPTDSMCPTICSGERVVADMDAFKKKEPQHGDVILFQDKSSGQLWTKRVIGVGGDFIQLGFGGTVLVNKEALSAPQICGKPIVPSDVPDRASPDFDFPPTKVVPQGSFFVVGDNLGHSYDSRYAAFGLVGSDQVRGKPLFLYWSPGRSRIGCPVR